MLFYVWQHQYMYRSRVPAALVTLLNHQILQPMQSKDCHTPICRRRQGSNNHFEFFFEDSSNDKVGSCAPHVTLMVFTFGYSGM